MSISRHRQPVAGNTPIEPFGPYPVDKIEIFTLQDNYIDQAVGDSSQIVQRVNDIEDTKNLFEGLTNNT